MIDDKILEHPIFDRKFETEEEFNTIEQTLAEAGIFMPEKFTWEPVKKVRTISYDAERKVFFTETGKTNEDIEELYESIRKKDRDVIFDDSVFQVEGIKRGVLGGADIKIRRGWRMLFEHHSPRPLAFHNYFSFLRLSKKWLANQDDWVAAYNFIQFHPMFWHVPNFEKYPYNWNTENGHNDIWVCVAHNDDGPVVMLEGGRSVEPHHNHHYHDHFLDVYGKNFEDAYIQFAKKIHEYHYLDGTERKNK